MKKYIYIETTDAETFDQYLHNCLTYGSLETYNESTLTVMKIVLAVKYL